MLNNDEDKEYKNNINYFNQQTSDVIWLTVELDGVKYWVSMQQRLTLRENMTLVLSITGR